MRLFTAIELPEEVRRHLEKVRDVLKRSRDVADAVSWVKRENWHITLKFLGDVEGPKIPEVIAALSRIVVEPMRLSIDRMVYFPKRGPVRVVATGMSGDVLRLSQIYSRIEEACHSIGFPREGRKYTAHVTIGRSRQGRGGGAMIGIRNQLLPELWPGPPFVATKFALIESRLSPQGAQYTPIAHFPRA